jgi:hypothetical protein
MPNATDVEGLSIESVEAVRKDTTGKKTIQHIAQIAGNQHGDNTAGD